MRVLLPVAGLAVTSFPLIAVALALKGKYFNREKDLSLLFLGSIKIIKEAFQDSGIRTHHIISGKLRRYPSARAILDAFLIFIGIIQSYFYFCFICRTLFFQKEDTAPFQ